MLGLPGGTASPHYAKFLAAAEGSPMKLVAATPLTLTPTPILTLTLVLTLPLPLTTGPGPGPDPGPDPDLTLVLTLARWRAREAKARLCRLCCRHYHGPSCSSAPPLHRLCTASAPPLCTASLHRLCTAAAPPLHLCRRHARRAGDPRHGLGQVPFLPGGAVPPVPQRLSGESQGMGQGSAKPGAGAGAVSKYSSFLIGSG